MTPGDIHQAKFNTVSSPARSKHRQQDTHFKSRHTPILPSLFLQVCETVGKTKANCEGLSLDKERGNL